MAYRLDPGQHGTLGDYLTNGQVTLTLETTGDLVLRQEGVENSLWHTDTAGTGVSGATMRQDGIFELEWGIWTTPTLSPRAYLFVHPNGFVAIYSEDDSLLWYRPKPVR